MKKNPTNAETMVSALRKIEAEYPDDTSKRAHEMIIALATNAEPHCGWFNPVYQGLSTVYHSPLDKSTFSIDWRKGKVIST